MFGADTAPPWGGLSTLSVDGGDLSMLSVDRTLPGGGLSTLRVDRTLPGGGLSTLSIDRTLPGGSVDAEHRQDLPWLRSECLSFSNLF